MLVTAKNFNAKINSWIKKGLLVALVSSGLFSMAGQADTYKIDIKQMHASINFEVVHFGFSILTGRFNTFSGEFNYDPAKLEASSVKVTIDVGSIDSNSAERDGHLRREKFLNTDAFAQATFVSKKIIPGADKNQFDIVGDFTLKGITKSITIATKKIGEGNDPWGGYRVGFVGTTEISFADFGIAIIHPASSKAKVTLYVEGIKN